MPCIVKIFLEKGRLARLFGSKSLFHVLIRALNYPPCAANDTQHQACNILSEQRGGCYFDV